jgi:hypothetical protein
VRTATGFDKMPAPTSRGHNSKVKHLKNINPCFIKKVFHKDVIHREKKPQKKVTFITYFVKSGDLEALSQLNVTSSYGISSLPVSGFVTFCQ